VWKNYAGFALNCAQANAWKTELGPDDLFQDLAVKFVELCHKYSDVYEPEHMMALFKTTCFRHIMSLARRKRVRRKYASVGGDSKRWSEDTFAYLDECDDFIMSQTQNMVSRRWEIEVTMSAYTLGAQYESSVTKRLDTYELIQQSPSLQRRLAQC